MTESNSSVPARPRLKAHYNPFAGKGAFDITFPNGVFVRHGVQYAFILLEAGLRVSETPEGHAELRFIETNLDLRRSKDGKEYHVDGYCVVKLVISQEGKHGSMLSVAYSEHTADFQEALAMMKSGDFVPRTNAYRSGKELL